MFFRCFSVFLCFGNPAGTGLQKKILLNVFVLIFVFFCFWTHAKTDAGWSGGRVVEWLGVGFVACGVMRGGSSVGWVMEEKQHHPKEGEGKKQHHQTWVVVLSPLLPGAASSRPFLFIFE